MRDTPLRVSRITLFACGEFYCYAVIFGLRRVIFATRVFRRIEYHCEAKPCNITVAMRQYHSLRQQRTPLLNQQKKREHFRYKTNLFSLFVCNKNLLRRTLLFALLIIRTCFAEPCYSLCS